MRKVLTPVLVLAVIVSLGVYQREVLAEILARLIDLPRISLVPLAVAACAMVCARGFFLLSCSPGITFRQAVIADQTALAAGYGIALGGGLVGTGMRIHMFTPLPHQSL
jgi:hypothetical protein